MLKVSILLAVLIALQTQILPTRMSTVNTGDNVSYMASVYSGDLGDVLRSRDALTLIVPSAKSMSESKDLRKKLGGDRPFLLSLIVDGLVAPTDLKETTTSKKAKSGNTLLFFQREKQLTVEAKGILIGVKKVKSVINCSNGIVYLLE